nr:L309 [uncultured bacterium]
MVKSASNHDFAANAIGVIPHDFYKPIRRKHETRLEITSP